MTTATFDDDNRPGEASEREPSDDCELAPRVPAGEFFSDPGARVAWAAITGLDEGQKHALLELLGSELAVPESRATPSQVRTARAVSAVREAAKIHSARGGKALRQEDFRSLHAEFGREHGWPSDGSIRRWLGGTWNDALRRAMLPAAPDGDAIVRELGPEYTREECVQAVLDYVADTGNPLPGFHSVINWARRRDVRARHGRRPRSTIVYQRLFGSWSNVLVAAGVVSADAVTGRVAGGDRGYGTSRPPVGINYTEEHIYAALREVAARLGRSPKQSEYQHERQLIFEEEQADGRPSRAMPSFSLIQGRYGTWDEALVTAGLPAVDGRRNARKRVERKPPIYSDEKMLAWIKEAFCELEHPFTSKAYIKWREAKLVAERAAGRFTRIPDFNTLYRRFGSWAQACERAGVPPMETR
jgi:hypothetical protein